MKKFHLAIGVSNVESSVRDYEVRLGKKADVVIPHEYALWRTEFLNFSIRSVQVEESGKLRHLGWENPQAKEFKVVRDCNGIAWEEFTADQQFEEIQQTWPQINHETRK